MIPSVDIIFMSDKEILPGGGAEWKSGLTSTLLKIAVIAVGAAVVINLLAR